MDGEIEKPQECYNIPGIRDFWNKYKSPGHGAKRQDDRPRRRHKSHIPSNINKVKPGDDYKIDHPNNAFEDQDFKASYDKKKEAHYLFDVNKVSQNGNGVEELKKTNNYCDDFHQNSNNYDDEQNSCFKSLILLSVPKKKKMPSRRVSSFDLPRTQSVERRDKSLPKARSFDPEPLGRSSRSINSSRKEQGTESYNTSKTPSFNRTTSTRTKTNSFNGANNASFNRTTSTGTRTSSFNGANASSFNRSTSTGRTRTTSLKGGNVSLNRATSDVAAIARKISRSGPVIMFSNSSGMLKPPATEKQLECTLEELYHGCVKHIKVSRDIFTHTGHISQEEEVLTVTIKPGWKTGTKITFQGTASDERPGDFPGDIIFVITEKHHPLFRRVDDDLELEIEIPLVNALTGCNLYIPLLGKDKKSIKIDDIVNSGDEKILVGEGMPNQKNPQHKGDLKVKFIVAYPKHLTEEQRSEIFRILSS